MRFFLNDDPFPINIHSNSISYPLDDIVDLNLPCDLQEKDFLYNEYFDLDGRESHSLQGEILIDFDLESIDYHPFSFFPFSKHKSICKHSDVFSFYSQNSFQVSNETNSNILLETCYDNALLELFLSGN